MKKKTKTTTYYTKKCPICNKEIEGTTEKQIDYRMKIHKLIHDKENQ